MFLLSNHIMLIYWGYQRVQLLFILFFDRVQEHIQSSKTRIKYSDNMLEVKENGIVVFVHLPQVLMQAHMK